MNHTKGPWYGVVPTFSREKMYEYTEISKAHGNIKATDADYTLMRYAPELLEALIELDQFVQSKSIEYPQGTFETVQNAIAKAKGETK